MVGARDDQATVDLGPRALEEAARRAESEGIVEGELTNDDPVGDAIADGSAFVSATRTVQAPGVHVLPTQQLPRKQVPGPGTSMSRISAGSQTTASPVDAMRVDEIERTRVFLKVAVALCVGGIVVALTAGGDPIARNVVIGGTGGALVGAFWMISVLRDAANYTTRRIWPAAVMIAAGSIAGVYYWGTASPVAAMLVYGIYFFSLGSDRYVTLGMYLLVAIAHGLLALGIIAGVIEDRGLVNMGGLRTLDQVSILVIIECLYFTSFLTARVSQRVTLNAMKQLEQAVRSVSQRDALLAEARAELDRALKIGGPGRFTEQVVGSFKLGVLIGRGGMGEVYEGRHVDNGSEAAVKLLHPGTLADPTHVQRFIREAETASRMNCPYVVRVLEVGTTNATIPFIAMERLRGHDLAHQLRRQRKLQLVQARTFAEQVALGLEAAREAGIVHRDLKPHNVFYAQEGGERRWKILDFGVSKAGSSGTLTQGHVIGTPAYMAPEQARGEDVDHRADVYSLGAILYRAVTGHPAFTGKDVPSTLYDVVYRVPTQPTILSTIPGDIDRVLAMGLAKDPADRFASALELAAWFSLAVESALDAEQRRRADAVVAKYPWGTRPNTSQRA